MDNYTVRLTGFGAPDTSIEIAISACLEIMRKGDVWNKRTGRQFDENVFSLTESVTYEEGFTVGIMRIIEKIDKSDILLSLYTTCTHVELQVWASPNVSRSIPSIHLTKEQVKWLADIHADVDIVVY